MRITIIAVSLSTSEVFLTPKKAYDMIFQHKDGHFSHISINKEEIMKTRVEETITKHDKGYNCAQAVACTYCDLVGIDEKIMFQLTEGLGLGMGGMTGTCGAVSGACVLAGMKQSNGNLEQPDSKADTYKLSKEIVKRFEEQNKSVVCKTLKGVETGTVLRSCGDCIKDAARIAEQVLFENEV